MSRIITGMPLCWTEEGQQIIEKKGLELQNWLDKKLYKNNISLHILDMECKNYPRSKIWWNSNKCQTQYCEFISNRENHFVNGEKWNNGEFGSRWADTTLAGISVRLAFYSRKYDPQMFGGICNNVKYLVITLVDNLEDLCMTENERPFLQKQKVEAEETKTKSLEELKVEAEEAETKLLADLEAEENKKSSPKKKKEKKIKETKVAVNPHKKDIRVSEGIWKPNPAWKKWEQENKRSSSQ